MKDPNTAESDLLVANDQIRHCIMFRDEEYDELVMNVQRFCVGLAMAEHLPTDHLYQC